MLALLILASFGKNNVVNFIELLVAVAAHLANENFTAQWKFWLIPYRALVLVGEVFTLGVVAGG